MAKQSKKQQSYAEYEIEFLEEKNRELLEYIKDRPFNELKDRIEWKQTKSGGLMPMVVATIEQQRKDLSQAMMDYAEIAQKIKTLRQEEDKKKQLEAKGSSQIPWAMRSRNGN